MDGWVVECSASRSLPPPLGSTPRFLSCVLSRHRAGHGLRLPVSLL